MLIIIILNADVIFYLKNIRAYSTAYLPLPLILLVNIVSQVQSHAATTAESMRKCPVSYSAAIPAQK